MNNRWENTHYVVLLQFLGAGFSGRTMPYKSLQHVVGVHLNLISPLHNSDSRPATQCKSTELGEKQCTHATTKFGFSP